MFDFNLYEFTKNVLFIIECNASGFRNGEVILLRGNQQKIFERLTKDYLLEEVKIDFHNSYLIKCERNGFEFIGEKIPVLSGVQSLKYYGGQQPLFTEGVEIFDYNEEEKTIRVLRLLSSFVTKTDKSVNNYLEFMNAKFQGWIDELNFAISYHNKIVIEKAMNKAAELHSLYVSHPEMFGRAERNH